MFNNVSGAWLPFSSISNPVPTRISPAINTERAPATFINQLPTAPKTPSRRTPDFNSSSSQTSAFIEPIKTQNPAPIGAIINCVMKSSFG